jgi:hypothetical protein
MQAFVRIAAEISLTSGGPTATMPEREAASPVGSETAMFGWFTPKSPLDTREKTWTEKRMRWPADQLGIDRLLDAQVVLPTPEFFPEPYNATADDPRRQVRQHLGKGDAEMRNLVLATLKERQNRPSVLPET